MDWGSVCTFLFCYNDCRLFSEKEARPKEPLVNYIVTLKNIL